MSKPVRYALETPLGEMNVLVDEGIASAVTFALEEGACTEGGSPPPPLVEEIVRALEVYFSGGEIDPALAERLIASIGATPFEESVLREVASVPPGETASYGDIAERSGYPRAARAVGNAMHSNPFPIVIPCHRVIKGDGGMGGYGGAERIKAWLLEFERTELER